MVYRRGVITCGVVSNESCCHDLGRRGCDNNGCDSSGCKFLPPHSRQAARSVIEWGVIARVAKEFRCHTPGTYGIKACDAGSKGCRSTPQNGTSTVPVPYFTRFDQKSYFFFPCAASNR